MTASKFDGSLRRAVAERRLARLALAILVGVLSACRAGLPPEPPGADPADPNAAAPVFQVQANPYETSAFAATPTAAPSEHAGHGHMGHGTPAPASDEHSGHGNMGEAPAGDEHSGHGNMGHGANAAGNDHAGHGQMQPAPSPPGKSEHAGHESSASNPEAAPANPPKQERTPR